MDSIRLQSLCRATIVPRAVRRGRHDTHRPLKEDRVAEIRPFRGIRYNSEVVADIEKVVAPPYDVIDSKQREELLVRHPYNVIRLILGKGFKDEDLDPKVYSRAASCFREWLSSGVLCREEEPAVYIYDQTFTCGPGERRTRRAIIAAVRLEPFSSGTILPHEQTLSGPKRDRLQLMRACQANFSQIFGLYPRCVPVAEALEQIAPTERAVIDFTDAEGISHQLRRIVDRETIRVITESLREAPIYIADGHHRYETALQYRDELRARSAAWDPENPANFVMMALVDMSSDGLVILPTHRVVRLPHIDWDHFWAQVKESFHVESAPDGAKQPMERISADPGVHRYGLYCDGGFYVLTLRADAPLDRLVCTDRSEAYNQLDVTLLHTIIIERILGLTADQVASGYHVHYTIDAHEAIGRVRSGQATLSLLLNPTRIEEVRAVAEAGDTMPQKSTYFYPKLLSGTVFNDLTEW